jgi:hypothetical protein
MSLWSGAVVLDLEPCAEQSAWRTFPIDQGDLAVRYCPRDLGDIGGGRHADHRRSCSGCACGAMVCDPAAQQAVDRARTLDPEQDGAMLWRIVALEDLVVHMVVADGYAAAVPLLDELMEARRRYRPSPGDGRRDLPRTPMVRTDEPRRTRVTARPASCSTRHCSARSPTA